ncbi:cytidylyltransferase domain-containing protein [Marinagarivorans algicola]|uniref:cytidylyltransferase domain-containing protein n=1 Tax=Marinagarivorans algicola TaxID=1513270 RepID=UPI00373590FC
MYSGLDLGVVIPVRLGSSRVTQKALLPVGKSRVSLLAWKIRQIKKILNTDNIYISTEAQELKDIAIAEGVQVHHRDYHLADGHKATFSEVITGIVKDIPHEHIAWVTAVVPLMSPQEYLGAFESYQANVVAKNPAFDSLISVNLLKEYFWNDDGPINYEANKRHTISQELPNIYRVTNGLYMAPKEQMLKKEYLIGDNPHKYVVSKMAGIDIDEYEDYEMSQGLFDFYIQEHDDLTRRNHVFLDFDGVVFNSVKESFVVAMLAVGLASDLSDVDFDGAEYQAFRAMRYEVGPAWNYYYVMQSLGGGKLSIPSVKSVEAEKFETDFFAARKKLRNSSYSDWLALHEVYDGFAPVIDMMRSNANKFSVITTKDESSVHSLLEDVLGVKGIPVYGANVFSKDGSKGETIKNLMTLLGVSSGVYVDDSKKHLASCIGIKGLTLIHSQWGYVSDLDQNDNYNEVITRVRMLLD